MSAFTAVTAGFDWQDVDFINEIINAYSERRQAIGQSAVDNIAAGTDIQAVSFWQGIQDWLESYCTGFVDHTQTIEGLSMTRSTLALPMFTLSTWRAEAGLNSSGFRRATSWVPGDPADWKTDVTFSYGQMQAGDIIGPWIFEDLQKGLAALKQTWSWTDTATDYEERYAIANESTCADARSHLLTDWAAASWSTSGGTLMYLAMAHGNGGTWHENRLSTKPTTGAYTFVTSKIDLYLLIDNYIGTFRDIDSLGMEENKLWYFEELPSDNTATRTASRIGKIDTDPVVDGGVDCANQAEVDVCAIINMWVFKWNFTYA